MGNFEIAYKFDEESALKEIAILNFFKKIRYGYEKESITMTIKLVKNVKTKEYEGYVFKDNEFKKHLKKDEIYKEITYLENNGFKILMDHPSLIKQITKYI